MESITPELIDMTDEEAKVFLRIIINSETAKAFLEKRAERRAVENNP